VSVCVLTRIRCVSQERDLLDFLSKERDSHSWQHSHTHSHHQHHKRGHQEHHPHHERGQRDHNRQDSREHMRSSSPHDDGARPRSAPYSARTSRRREEDQHHLKTLSFEAISELRMQTQLSLRMLNRPPSSKPSG
jgi:hypothetical protein